MVEIAQFDHTFEMRSVGVEDDEGGVRLGSELAESRGSAISQQQSVGLGSLW